jgi:hypothetical protein
LLLSLVASLAPHAALAVPILHIDWRRLPDFPKQGGPSTTAPSGLEASSGGWISPELVVAGFGYPSGGATAFQNTAWLLNTSDPESKWTRLPDAPVCGRQDVGAAVIGGSVYFVGGFSYTAPFSYNDTLKLSRDGDGSSWVWTVLPSVPYAVSSYGGVVARNRHLRRRRRAHSDQQLTVTAPTKSTGQCPPVDRSKCRTLPRRLTAAPHASTPASVLSLFISASCAPATCTLSPTTNRLHTAKTLLASQAGRATRCLTGSFAGLIVE